MFARFETATPVALQESRGISNLSMCGADTVGSVCVEPNQVADLLRHWNRPVEGSSKQQSQKQNPVVAAMMTAKARVVNPQAILRGCSAINGVAAMVHAAVWFGDTLGMEILSIGRGGLDRKDSAR